MDVAVWLCGLGLEQYAPAFQDNAIDGEVLRELTADDLKDLGVAPVGHRRKLLAAITALGKEPATLASQRCERGIRCHLTANNRRRAPPTDGDVLRHRRLDRAVDATSIPRICAS